MTLIEVFNKTKQGEQVCIDSVDEKDLNGQVKDLFNFLYNNKEIVQLSILEYPEDILLSLAKSAEPSASASATITLMHLQLPELDLDQYV